MTEIFSHPEHPLTKTYKHEEHDVKPFPLFLAPPSEVTELLASSQSVLSYLKLHREYILNLLKEHTVILFRNFASGTSTPEDFAEFLIQGLGFRSFPYTLGNAVRKSIVGDIVFTANEAPPDKLIPFHHELAQTPKYPLYISFYCNLPSDTGGETPIVNSIQVYGELKNKIPKFIQNCELYGVIYKRRMTSYDRKESAIGRGWKSTFNVTNKEQVENILKQKNYQWSWSFINDEEILTEISPKLNAVISINDKKKAFFNQMFAAWNGWIDEFNKKGDSLCYGNGNKIDSNDMDIVSEVLEKHEVAIPWERGDFMLIDNLQAMHSRKSFTGKRSILASLLT